MSLCDTLDDPRYSVQVSRRVEVPDGMAPMPANVGEWSSWGTLLTCDGKGAQEAMEAFQRANRGRRYRLVHAPTDRERWCGATVPACPA